MRFTVRRHNLSPLVGHRPPNSHRVNRTIPTLPVQFQRALAVPVERARDACGNRLPLKMEKKI